MIIATEHSGSLVALKRGRNVIIAVGEGALAAGCKLTQSQAIELAAELVKLAMPEATKEEG